VLFIGVVERAGAGAGARRAVCMDDRGSAAEAAGFTRTGQQLSPREAVAVGSLMLDELVIRRATSGGRRRTRNVKKFIFLLVGCGLGGCKLFLNCALHAIFHRRCTYEDRCTSFLRARGRPPALQLDVYMLHLVSILLSSRDRPAFPIGVLVFLCTVFRADRGIDVYIL
jgi:hypothetical protein